MTEYMATVRATDYPPQQKHQVIFQTFRNLQPSESMLLINDHDPVPLHFQMNTLHPGKFTWDYIEQGPEVYQVKICRLK